MKHALDVPKIETTEYVPSSAHVDDAIAARRGLRALIRHGDMNKLEPMKRKSLLAFSFGTNAFMMAPEMAAPQPDLQTGLGELEIKAETIRFVACATSDLLEDASFDVQSWLLDKVSQGMRASINEAILIGDGLGKPMGLLHQHSGIPVC